MVTFSNEEESTMEIFGQQVIKSFMLFSVIIQSGIQKRSISWSTDKWWLNYLIVGGYKLALLW